MRSNNGQPAGPRYRVINNNRKFKALHKSIVPSAVMQNTKRCSQTQLKRMSQVNNSPQHGDFQEDYMTDAEYISETELEYANPGKQNVLKSLSSTIRPLLQLFSDDSCSPMNTAPAPAAGPPPEVREPATPQIVYKNISLSSEEEEEDKASLQEQSISEEFLTTSEDQHRVNRPRLDSLSRFEWSPKSTNIFLDLWEKNLKDLRGTRKNSHIHKEMAEEMSEYGPSHREIKSKMDNMSRKFRLEMKKIKSGIPTNWRYFKRVQFLLIGTPSVDFEEIIFDNTDSSTFFNADSSEEENDMNVASLDEKVEEQLPLPSHKPPLQATANEEAEDREQADESRDPPPPTLSRSLKDEESSYPKNRMLEIEEQKLAVERQKLQVMKHISRELTSISKTLVELLRNAK